MLSTLTDKTKLNTAQKIALAKTLHHGIMFFRRMAGRSAETEVTRGGLRWHLNLNEGIDFSIYTLGSFEPATIKLYETLVKPGDVVLDIGANIGAHTLPLARLVGETGQVIAFEPTSFAIHKLVANLSLNQELVARVTALQMMLVAERGAPLESAIFSSWPLVSSKDLHEKHKGRLMNTTGAVSATLDQTIEELNLNRLDFIKLDVDGHEFEVLCGAMETIGKHKPRILLELAPYVYAENPQAFDKMLGKLWGIGYAMKDVANGRTLPRDSELVRRLIPQDGGINVLATST